MYIPSKEQREYRRLVKYRKVVLGRMIRIQNNIRASFAQRGIKMERGRRHGRWNDSICLPSIANLSPTVPSTNCGVANWIWN